MKRFALALLALLTTPAFATDAPIRNYPGESMPATHCNMPQYSQEGRTLVSNPYFLLADGNASYFLADGDLGVTGSRICQFCNWGTSALTAHSQQLAQPLSAFVTTLDAKSLPLTIAQAQVGEPIIDSLTCTK